jgi:multisubunit Na+/H+ antiporter MnhB subunit
MFAAWLTAAVYAAGVAMILVAFAYRYRPSPWLRIAAQGAVVAAVALAVAAGIVVWRARIGALPAGPAPASAERPASPK